MNQTAVSPLNGNQGNGQIIHHPPLHLQAQGTKNRELLAANGKANVSGQDRNETESVAHGENTAGTPETVDEPSAPAAANTAETPPSADSPEIVVDPPTSSTKVEMDVATCQRDIMTASGQPLQEVLLRLDRKAS
ncbi:hypothetical protein L596_000331 [Steinernema carpocapsae]|uniref:Uncharacterized protein n=1 Tax=Steinernema carpocapsae TaxID=34508 RepID=A0A4U8UIN1_STECR|nr:hypothetical protein L596_000331 [Steinernema carpocapsae]